MELTIFCPCSAKVRIEADDRLGKCPRCRRVFITLAGKVEQVSAARSRNWIQETIVVEGQEVVLNHSQRSEITPGNIVAAVWFAGRLVGVADASRQLWFPGSAAALSPPALLWLLVPIVVLVAGLAAFFLSPWAWIPVLVLFLLAWRVPAEPEFELGWDLS